MIPASGGQPVLVGGGVDQPPGRPALHVHGAARRVDLDRLHRRQIDDDAVVDGAEARSVVPPAAHGDGGPGPAARLERRLHVGHRPQRAMRAGRRSIMAL